MFEHEIAIFDLNHGLCQRLVADVQDSEFALQPSPGMNCPVWILGHLTTTLDSAGGFFGLPPECPPRWNELFGRGSTPPGPDVELPSKQELLDALQKGHARVRGAMSRANAEAMGKPHQLESMQAMPLKSVGDLVAFVVTGHYCFHLGQLSAWRRVTGRPPLF